VNVGETPANNMILYIA